MSQGDLDGIRGRLRDLGVDDTVVDSAPVLSDPLLGSISTLHGASVYD